MNTCAKCGEYIPAGHACVIDKTVEPQEYYHISCYPEETSKCHSCRGEIFPTEAPWHVGDKVYHNNLTCYPQGGIIPNEALDQQESFNDFKIKQLVDRKDLMVKYLNLKVSEEDWHGVQDAASDLRDLQVELETRKDLRNDQ